MKQKSISPSNKKARIEKIKEDNKFEELVHRVKEKVRNNVYEPKITKIMSFEKVGYAKASKVLMLL
tara:strand:- start:425 stop:622 length:198 start_codon:yes stop_codon:yes gene_type:complete